MTQTLAEILRATEAAEKDGTKKLEAARFAAASAENAKNSAAIRDFYAAAKKTIELQITTCAPTKNLGVLVGDTGRTRENMEVYDLLRLYKGVPPATSQYHVYEDEFQQWAQDQGLQAKWVAEHDGVGVHGWARLTVVAPPLKKQ